MASRRRWSRSNSAGLPGPPFSLLALRQFCCRARTRCRRAGSQCRRLQKLALGVADGQFFVVRCRAAACDQLSVRRQCGAVHIGVERDVAVGVFALLVHEGDAVAVVHADRPVRHEIAGADLHLLFVGDDLALAISQNVPVAARRCRPEVEDREPAVVVHEEQVLDQLLLGLARGNHGGAAPVPDLHRPPERAWPRPRLPSFETASAPSPAIRAVSVEKDAIGGLARLDDCRGYEDARQAETGRRASAAEAAGPTALPDRAAAQNLRRTLVPPLAAHQQSSNM